MHRVRKRMDCSHRSQIDVEPWSLELCNENSAAGARRRRLEPWNPEILEKLGSELRKEMEEEEEKQNNHF